eukprot:CAMPEP_0202959188 /NCGR_PEP_ID=MMETSP1396-20130829/3447_1 /ASSEMBLY_ACC=CAM_ASM_000872 /TAXON_ID= /ORGANISM="Pseudokeronopsis sp., Strain Brazil" /LENGTH=88 /DNA_ID=CAMNT_0049677649 /DNA_START=545 /DNA_END=811 /DNA_ORIENTATION=-
MIIGFLVAFVLQIVLLFFFLFGSGAKDSGVYTAYLGIIILIYAFYVIIDLKMIANRLDLDDYILGALTLYLDLMVMFVYILEFIGKQK